MPDKLLDAEDLTTGSREVPPDADLLDKSWIPVLRHSCDFPPSVFDIVSLNLIRNPNINSSLLFRADILFDSSQESRHDSLSLPKEVSEALQTYHVTIDELDGFSLSRIIIRRMIPRNPTLDKPIAQTCLFLNSADSTNGYEKNIVLYIPHCYDSTHLPWYHPRVKSLAYLHTWQNAGPKSSQPQGTLSLHFKLFAGDSLPLEDRLMRTGQHLLSTVYKHGQGNLAGYTKRVKHDQIVSQQRIQDTYSELKSKHAKRLCENWAEKTEPSKHVFEDLGIAAFLIELWRDMYRLPLKDSWIVGPNSDAKPSFPGFVDIGCGNGVLVDVLLREGYHGWGFDARRRKSWATFSKEIEAHIEQRILVPQPFFESSQLEESQLGHANAGILSQLGQLGWHNGIFPKGTFIISNHADELTPWTPLLASISNSPFLAIPCCSHNLSGSRFRAPSIFNDYSADIQAPSYFAANVSKSKSVAIRIACPDNDYGMKDEQDDPENENGPAGDDQRKKRNAPETGDLKVLSAKSRSGQPSAYSSLCDWVSHLSEQVGYVVEKEILRLPSTRNVGLICRERKQEGLERDTTASMNLVLDIVRREKADGKLWVGRARGLILGQTRGNEH